MHQALSPVARQSLSDGLAERIRQLIQTGDFRPGDRLPSIADMARRFGVGHPTLREALKKLETLGIVTIRHGSGVYVGRDDNSLLISNPVFSGSFTRKLLVDLIEARTPIELTTVGLAARNATLEHLREMKSLLTQAGESLGDDAVLSRVNMAFHREIAKASGNAVLAQLLEVLTNIFHEEQRAILSIYGSRQKDHAEHVRIFEALTDRDADLAAERMQAHLDGVREVLLRWDQENESAES
jgi:GntR family transcriptional regulator, transcriptional repressor for pyruvate dehydrogenase complex